MYNEPVFTPAPRRIHRKRKSATVPAPSAQLTLVAAEYEDATSLTLTFDRAIDVSTMVVDFLAVKDASINERLYIGTGTPLIVSPTSVRVELVDVDPFEGTGITLTADPGNGVVAVSDGTTWPGVTNLQLPFWG